MAANKAVTSIYHMRFIGLGKIQSNQAKLKDGSRVLACGVVLAPPQTRLQSLHGNFVASVDNRLRLGHTDRGFLHRSFRIASTSAHHLLFFIPPLSTTQNRHHGSSR